MGSAFANRRCGVGVQQILFNKKGGKIAQAEFARGSSADDGGGRRETFRRNLGASDAVMTETAS